MEIAYSAKAKEDIAFWKLSGNKQIQAKITSLLIVMEESPYNGIGKPEQLKHSLSGAWSCRINQEHRLVYEVQEERILILSAKGHYL